MVLEEDVYTLKDMLLDPTLFNSVKDEKLIWRHNNNGVFSVISSYISLDPLGDSIQLWSEVYIPYLSPKIN